jgi:hypothetical protein
VSPLLSGIIAVLLYTAIRYLVLQASEPIARGLICLPIFYGVTIAINIFTVVHDGSQRKCVTVYARTVPYVMTVEIKPEIHVTIYSRTVTTSQRTHHVSGTKQTWFNTVNCCLL